MAATSLAFVARRGEPELVAPAGPTPRELKRLSDLDDQESLRFYRSGIYFYRGCPSRARADPARVVRDGLAAALVHYYPIAGRLRELPGRKLAVDCTGEGVWFVEADADVALDEFGDTLCPPVPCAGQLLCLPESNCAVVVDRPLLYVQVTRLRCGGFVFGIQVCHNLMDAPGVTQFLQAVGELAGGMEAPSVRPVWARELLDARDPPCPSYQHPEYELAADAANDRLRPGAELVHRAFLFGPKELSSLRDQLPPRMRLRCSRFLLLSAFAWRCRTAALGYAPGDEVRFMFVVNARGKRGRPLPEGFYGNALTFGVARTTAGELCSGPLGRAVELIVAAMARVAADNYAQSVADALVLLGRPRFTTARTYLVTDLTKANLHNVDLGWGLPVYGGPATTTLATFHIPAAGGGITVPMCLPPRAMERFTANVRAGLSEASSHRGRSSGVESAVLSRM
ncbi:benzyl alcohol O-benzoyltransferase-like [Triticum urartu]|nr:benzyl alcohol O-benzoyltransferase-like [Triticum urartu]